MLPTVRAVLIVTSCTSCTCTGCSEFAKMCPRVTDISFVGSLRIMLVPLVDTIPGFGARPGLAHAFHKLCCLSYVAVRLGVGAGRFCSHWSGGSAGMCCLRCTTCAFFNC